jgi:hypothetical protein
VGYAGGLGREEQKGKGARAREGDEKGGRKSETEMKWNEAVVWEWEH